MKSLLKFENMNQEDILLYSLLAIVIITTLTFLGIYFLWVPFWPARIVHIVYLLFHFLLIYLLKKKKYLFVKVSILTTNLIQLALATFFWFPLTTRYELFYILLPMGAFAIMDLLNPKERFFAFSITFFSFTLFFLNSFMGINQYMFEISDFAATMISFLTITSTMGILALYFYLHAYFLAQKKVELEYLANTDSLTEICNRRNFFHIGELEFNLAHKYNHVFSLLMLDIDYFKKVNDTYGHDVGDEVLKAITKTIKDNIRQSDILARYGGEEFTLLLRKTDLKTGIQVAEKVRDSVENMVITLPTATLKITTSIGVVQFSKDFEEFSKLIILADKALYDAKDQGRNRVAYKEFKDID